MLQSMANPVESFVKKNSRIFRSRFRINSLYLRITSNAVVKASYRIAQQIVMSSKSFSEGSFVKTCMLIVVEEICPEKRQDFANISLSKNTVVDRICDLSENIQQQLS